MPVTKPVVFLILFHVLFLTTFVLPKAIGAEDANSKQDSNKLKDLVGDYWNWWINLPTEQNPEGSVNQCTTHNSGSVILLLDPFQMGNIKQRCDIPAGSSVLFPFYIGWCDTGIENFYGEKSYARILGCALDANRGIVTMKAVLDNKTIIDIQVDNKDVHNPKVLKNNLPQGAYYKKITTDNFFNLTVSNKTQFTLYEKPEDFKFTPHTYRAAGDCFCGLVNATDLLPGSHKISYVTSVKGSEGADDPKGWNYDSDITYELKVTK